MLVLTAQSVVEAQDKNLAVLKVVQDTIRVRLNSGAATAADMAQAESRVSRGIADLNAARTDLEIQKALYQRIVGAMPPARMVPAMPFTAQIPASEERAYQIGYEESPAVRLARHQVAAAEAAVRVAQAAMLPQANLQASIRHDRNPDVDRDATTQGQVFGVVTVPIYAGGVPESQVRQQREYLTAARIQLDAARLQTRTAIKSAAASFSASATLVKATTDELTAAEEAYRGIKIAADAGARTVTDMLNAQQDVVVARVRNLTAQRDR